MNDESLRFDGRLPGINADQLKPMARLWGGKSLTRKDELIACIRAGLADPEKVRAALAELEPYERFALALIKLMGGRIDANALSVGLHASGLRLPPRLKERYFSSDRTIYNALFRRGLVLSTYPYDPFYLYGGDGSGTLFSDERLLAEAGLPELVPLELAPAPAPPTASSRRPQTVALSVFSILQAIQDLGGLLLTKTGQVRATEQRKLARALNWEEDGMTVDGFHFANPSLAWISVLSVTGLLVRQGDRLALAHAPEDFAMRPYPEQAALLLDGFVRTKQWNEQWKEKWRSYHDSYYSHARLALRLALTALPAEGAAWYALSDLDKALFERIGEHFSLDYLPSRPFAYQKSPEQIRKEEAEWRARLRIDWLKRERRWIEQAMTSWLYYLGIVELGMDKGAVVSFRLTDLGRAALHPELQVRVEHPVVEGQQPWIVQPNFEIVVYLDRTTPAGLAFLERHAERVQAQQHTAIYRLTRESVYRGLEAGATAESLLETLRSGSETGLPQIVSIEIREWAALREKITLHRRGRLLEFESPAARQAALDQGVEGIPVGEVCLLLPQLPLGSPSETGTAGIEVRQIDYSRPLPKCLSIQESGEVRLKTDLPDLMIAAQLTRWAEALPGKTWRFTRESVSTAVARGGKIDDLFDLLAQRLIHGLPRLLRVALLHWAGEPGRAELSTVSILRVRNPEVLQAISSSKLFKPYLLGQIAPDGLVVDTAQLAALQEKLRWAGFEVGEIVL